MKMRHRGSATTSMAPAVNQLPVIAASGTIGRGKLTFFTRFALATRLCEADIAPPMKNVHIVRPTNRNRA